MFLNNFPRLKYVYLNDNNFTGDLPIDWCLGSWWMFDVSDNPGICDEVPGCLMERLVSFKGTSLVDPVSDDDGGMGGYCGVAPPTCRVEQDSCWVQVPDPAWWTDPSKVSFSFPDFPSTEGGTAPQYTWRLGTTPGAGDVIDWTPFEGKNVTQSAEVMEPGDNKGTVISQVVNIANGTLPNGIGLQQGETYYVSVRGANAGGVLNGLIVTSDPVTVDYTPPVLPAGSAVYSGQYLANIPAQTNTNGIGVSWDSFEDDESGVQQYAYQVFEYNTAHADGQQPDYVGDSQTSKVNLKDVTTRDVYITKLDLEPGKSYFVRVYVENGAGLETYV